MIFLHLFYTAKHVLRPGYLCRLFFFLQGGYRSLGEMEKNVRKVPSNTIRNFYEKIYCVCF